VENTSQNWNWEPETEVTTKELYVLDKKDTAFAICAVAASVFAAVFGICGGFSLGYLLTIVLMTALFSVYLGKGNRKRGWPVLCGLLALANGAVFVCTSNESVRFFGGVISFLLALVCFDGLVSGGTKGNRQTVGVFYSALSTMGNIGVSVRSLFSNENGDKKTLSKVLVGILCAVPVLLVVVPLLLSSDEAFSGMMNKLFENTSETFFKVLLGLVLSLFVIAYGFSVKADSAGRIKQGKSGGVENVYLISFLSAISLCYVLYLFSQLAYFFSAFRGFLPDGEITYAQYARKGFFEMCAIAMINLGIVFLAMMIAKKENGKAAPGVRAVATFIAVFTLIIIATAISKMVLYIGAYGMTVLRLTTSAFMVFLSIVFVSVVLRIYVVKVNIVKTALIAAGCIVLILGTVNVNRVCAAYNYESYRNGRLPSIDLEALYGLGDEGIPYIVELASDENAQTAAEAKRYLWLAFRGEHENYFEMLPTELPDEFGPEALKKYEKNTGFSYYSIPRAKAYDSLYAFLKAHPEFL